ncbi:unnamed protein product [Prorocentrum cordatum]|uniref:Uncharacterized protein n=1 Tax=Prorocentrum cordatum TaxID=2364126 RepID=A0ABN9T9L8_9DINO|nr:unnamed protein product [Polarella glacialis]
MQRMQWVVKKKDPGNATEKRESWADSSPLGNAEVRVEPAPAAIGSTPVRGKRRRGKFVKEDLAPDAEPAADEAEWEEEQWDWSPYVIVRDASVAVMLTRSGMRDKDLPGLFVYLEEALKKVRGSKPCHKYDVDLSDNKEITDRGVVEHLVPFLERWPDCHRLKLYKTSCGEEAISCLAPWVSRGYARELHLSDMGGQVSGESVLTLLRQVHRGEKYPYRLNDKASCALWLRLEHNGIPSKEVVQKASKDGLSFRVVDKDDIRSVGQAEQGACQRASA